MKIHYKYKCLNCGKETMVDRRSYPLPWSKKNDFREVAIDSLSGYLDTGYNYDWHCCINFGQDQEFHRIHKCNEDEYGLLHLVGVKAEEQ